MPKLQPLVTNRVPARMLCRSQRPTNFGSMPCARRRMADDFVLWLHRGHLKKAVRIVKGERATRALERSQPMGEAMPREVERIMLKARMHLDMLVRGAVPSGDEETHDYLCHVIGISQIRVCDIGVANRTHGGIQSANELMATLNAAAQGLARARQRYEKMGCWGLDDPAIEPLREALDIYETVLGASSAMQMEQAQTARLAKLQAQMGVAA
jgi:hypothetical protein